MKKTTALCLALSLTLGTAGTAQADWERHGGHRGPSYEHRHHHGHRGGPNWVGPAALLAITGLAIGAVAYSQAAPAQVYSAPRLRPATTPRTDPARIRQLVLLRLIGPILSVRPPLPGRLASCDAAALKMKTGP